MNWGHKITLVIVIFILTMVGMVYISFKQTNEMMDENYYDKEIKYQKLIDASNNLKEIHQDSLLQMNDDAIIMQFPTGTFNQYNVGKIEFLCQDKQKNDYTVSLKPNSEGEFIVDKNKLKQGSYTARIYWKNNNIAYYREEKFKIK